MTAQCSMDPAGSLRRRTQRREVLRRKVMERGGWAERRASEAFRGARRGWSAVGRAADSACLGRKRIGALALAVACAAAGCAGGEPALMEPVASARQAHDLVIAGGRVIDPESGLDAVRHVGIQDGTVVAISEDPLEGSATVDAAGLVVAPGFVDLHAHGQDPASSRYQAMDGVTTALELEIGAFPVERWYARRGGASLINYGASVSHQAARIRALGSPFARSNADGTFSLGESDDDTLYRAASDEELARLRQLMERGLREGGIGLGFGLSYTPGVSHRELLQMFQVAAEYEAPAFIHLRSAAAFERLTLEGWHTVFTVPGIGRTIVNTLVVSIVASLGVIALSFAVSYILVRTDAPYKRSLDMLAFSPHAVPGVVLGISLVFLFVYLDRLLALGLYGTIWPIAVGFIIAFLPFGTRATTAGLLQLHKELEEAGSICGAARWRVLSRISFPLLMPTFLIVFLWTFGHVFRMTGLPLMLFGSEKSQVIGVLLWFMWDDSGQFNAVSALGICLILFLLLTSLVLYRLQRANAAGRLVDA